MDITMVFGTIISGSNPDRCTLFPLTYTPNEASEITLIPSFRV